MPFIYSYIGINCFIKWTYQRRRCCVFDSPGLLNDSAGYPGVTYGLWGTTPREGINAEGVVRLIAQGWRQPTLGYACSEEVNAVGVVRFLRGMP
ncbi:hypothetical protein [Segatella salivae]|uniref:hypothetical protein n=1 Tax=Segatella salivae TaxID=228604 RepID=UPI00241DCAB2|nr:hypothetical protein [Segatella salivae]